MQSPHPRKKPIFCKSSFMNLQRGNKFCNASLGHTPSRSTLVPQKIDELDRQWFKTKTKCTELKPQLQKWIRPSSNRAREDFTAAANYLQVILAQVDLFSHKWITCFRPTAYQTSHKSCRFYHSKNLDSI